MISGAEMMVKCLQAENVTITFGYPGAVICPFYDFLEKTEIEHVLVRSEQTVPMKQAVLHVPAVKRVFVLQHPVRRYQSDYRSCHCIYGFHSSGCNYRPG